MIWHTHMLNPRAYLEDCMLSGRRPLWTGGMPWEVVNAAINNHFEYAVSESAKDSWKKQTGLAWNNLDDDEKVTIHCPACKTSVHIPWTTCSVPAGTTVAGPPDLVGTGYGDGKLSHTCSACGSVINKDLLCVAKFIDDIDSLLGKGRPMPGTVLNFGSGTPVLLSKSTWKVDPPNIYPNQMLRKRNDDPKRCVTGLITPGANPTMQDVRDKIEKMVKRQGDTSGQGIYVRKMMSRYWDNWSPFALDLKYVHLRTKLKEN